jgi:hypothetical protein
MISTNLTSEKLIERKLEKLTADDLERKTQSLLKEYFHVRDLNEARQCVQDLDSPGYHAQFLFQAISSALEQKELHVQMVGELIDHLFSQQTVSKVVLIVEPPKTRSHSENNTEQNTKTQWKQYRKDHTYNSEIYVVRPNVGLRPPSRYRLSYCS